MRHAVAIVAAAAAIAIALVLVLGEDETAEDTDIVAPAETTGRPPGGETTPGPPAGERDTADVAQIERAVALHVEAAESGQQPARGLPTSDELTILAVRRAGDRASVRLAGGTRLVLRRTGGRWRVTEVVAGGAVAPTPPSNG